MKLYLEFDVVAVWTFHGMVYPYFTDPKTESAQLGDIDHGYNSRPLHTILDTINRTLSTELVL